MSVRPGHERNHFAGRWEPPRHQFDHAFHTSPTADSQKHRCAEHRFLPAGGLCNRCDEV